MDDCNFISSDEVELLKEIVVDVVWDGVEQERVSTDHWHDLEEESLW